MEQTEILYQYLLHLGDNSLIQGQRDGEWCGHGPVLEQDIALTNIALDLFGEARNIFAAAARLKGNGETEDSIAFLRDVLQYKNALLVEQPNQDWAYTIVKHFFYDNFHNILMTELCNSNNTDIKAIAHKSVKETNYHARWSNEWMIRLGDGTTVSKEKVQTALNELWEYSGEFFIATSIETQAEQLGFGANLETIHKAWTKTIDEILLEATLEKPSSTFFQKGGKTGIHSEYLGFVLAEMQYLQRAYPGAEW